MQDNDDARLASLRHWLEETLDLAVKGIETASVDASFRRYFRVHSDGSSYIAMDAPPARENCGPFVRIAGWLREIGVNSPVVLGEDLHHGFLLLTDFGTRQYYEALRENPQRVDSLYVDAMQTLHRLQLNGVGYQSGLPPYSGAVLQREMSLFRDWLCGKHLQIEFSDADDNAWRSCCERLIESALAQPRVFVHRDFHSRNLMLTDSDNPGVLDFQDAVNGPLTYDLVSLLRDCYLRWPGADTRRRALAFFHDARERIPRGFDEAAFLRAFDLMGVQRHLKAAGIFARLYHRDGKPRYLADVPRTLAYIVDVSAHYPALRFLSDLLRERCLPRLEART